MAKVPVAGYVKTRLQTILSPDECADLALCLLTDTIEKASEHQSDLIIAYSPPERGEFFDAFSQHKHSLIPQTGADLGEKMFNAFDFVFSQGLDSVVMIGTDSPTFPPEFIENAFELMEKGADAVLGKTEDGGFYLIGLRVFEKKIFEKVKWGSAEAFQQTVRNIEKRGLRLSLLPEWYDVDRPEDLKRLALELNEFPEAAPKTAKWLAKHKQH